MSGEARLVAGRATDASGLTLAHEPVPADQVVAGAPATGHAVLDEAAGRTIGVWEMTRGAMRDVEADEVFVVLSGDATVEFEDAALPSIELGPGSVVRLEAGMRTVWTVRETLRKVYVAP
ncbi:cupin domain-containing protein [Agromyces silvae]|uniref:cupin domain-containing protein n=1 Tax=Agromyces silvae TaxID=3388266 RepID=UPI00280A5F93|nr:cupin domain-containing protein [Agromyces protaetiae]